MSTESLIPWSRVSPEEFEELCQVILGYLGFLNIERLGGPGDRGRDIVCDYPITLKNSISFNQKWVVQCKHTRKKPSIDVIEPDLRRANQHEPDVWLLMTSNTVSPATHDWLHSVERGNYRFAIKVLDGTELARILDQEPRLLPGVRSRLLESQASIGDIYHLMMEGRYEEALAGIQNAVQRPTARLLYLKACCCSELARRMPGDRERLVADAFESLAETLELDYVSEVSRLKKWPKAKVFVEMQLDSELEFIKKLNLGRFIGLLEKNGYSKQEDEGGCLVGDTAVLMGDGSEKPITEVGVGESTLSPRRVSPGPLVLERICHRSEGICVINNRLACSFSQPLLASGRWVTAAQLRYGDSLENVAGCEPVINLRFDEPQEVHMIRLSSGHEFFADGYVVHNKI